MKSLKALKNRSAEARGIKASALAALGASVLLIGAMLSACGSSGETRSMRRSSTTRVRVRYSPPCCRMPRS